MQSKILGNISYDKKKLDPEINEILEFPHIKDSYTEFVFGNLLMHVLWNPSGKARDNVFQENAGEAVPTEYGQKLPYINSIIESTFHTKYIRMVRANLLYNCLLVPHRDYTEIKSGYSDYIRLHLPIHTDISCLNSEGGSVFHMRFGEIWKLNISNVHAAYCPTDFPRISIMIDFNIKGISLDDIFKDKKNLNAGIAPHLIQREMLNDAFLQSIMNLSKIISKENYADIVQLLSKVHFYKKTDISSFYDWLEEICVDANSKDLVDKSKKLKTFFAIHRDLGERFNYFQF